MFPTEVFDIVAGFYLDSNSVKERITIMSLDKYNCTQVRKIRYSTIPHKIEHALKKYQQLKKFLLWSKENNLPFDVAQYFKNIELSDQNHFLTLLFDHSETKRLALKHLVIVKDLKLTDQVKLILNSIVNIEYLESQAQSFSIFTLLSRAQLKNISTFRTCKTNKIEFDTAYCPNMVNFSMLSQQSKSDESSLPRLDIQLESLEMPLKTIQIHIKPSFEWFLDKYDDRPGVQVMYYYYREKWAKPTSYVDKVKDFLIFSMDSLIELDLDTPYSDYTKVIEILPQFHSLLKLTLHSNYHALKFKQLIEAVMLMPNLRKLYIQLGLSTITQSYNVHEAAFVNMLLGYYNQITNLKVFHLLQREKTYEQVIWGRSITKVLAIYSNSDRFTLETMPDYGFQLSDEHYYRSHWNKECAASIQAFKPIHEKCTVNVNE